MDDYEESEDDYEDYDSGGDVFDEEDYDDDEEEEDDVEEGDQEEEDEEEEDAEDEMEDFEEEEEEITEIGEQFEGDEVIAEDQGVEIEYGEEVEEVEEELVEYEEDEVEEEEEALMEDEGEEEEELFEEEEELFEEEEEDDELYGDDGSYEEYGDYENEIAAGELPDWPQWAARAPTPANFAPFMPSVRFRVGLGGLDLNRSHHGGEINRSRSSWRRSERGDGTAPSRLPEAIASGETENAGGSDSSMAGFQGTNCPICFDRWTGEGEHCVCCLPCGHLYGFSCIKMWLQRPNSQKCPQCNDFCELADVRRLYGLQLAITGVEELQEKVKCLEAKCASLELKDTDWLRKEADWLKREADLQEQLNKQKEAKTDLPKDTSERRDPPDESEPVGREENAQISRTNKQ